MDATYESDERTPTLLPAHAALITGASRLNGAPHKGWYFAVMVRAAMARLEGSA
jgi:hypothetical protein